MRRRSRHATGVCETGSRACCWEEVDDGLVSTRGTVVEVPVHVLWNGPK